MYELLTQKLDPQQIEKHRMRIALKAEALLNNYFVAPVRDEIKYEMMLGWMKTLENYSKNEIEAACWEHLIEEPRRKPHEGIIRERVINARRRYMKTNTLKHLVELDKDVKEPVENSVDMEERRKTADKIMQEVFGSKKI